MIGMVACTITVLIVSLIVNQRAIERERSARIAAAQSAEASRVALCGIYVLLDDAYRARPPAPKTTGAELAVAVAAARIANHCAAGK